MQAITLGLTHIGATYWHGGGWFWWPLIPLFWLALVGLIIFAVWRCAGRGRPIGSSAKNILAERFARGEIDVDDYRSRMEVLS